MDALDDAILEVGAKAEQRSPAWHNVRLGRITSSEIWKIMSKARSGDGLSETGKKYIRGKVHETLTGIESAPGYSAAMSYGEDMEPVAKEHLAKMGYVIEPATFVPFGDHCGGTPDGIIEGKDRLILEIKCPFIGDNFIELAQCEDQSDLLEVKPEYYWQCMSNLLFSNSSDCLFAAFDPNMPEGKKIWSFWIHYDQAAAAKITERIEVAIKYKLELLNALQ